MNNNLESVLTILFLAGSAGLLINVVLRVRSLRRPGSCRIPVWSKGLPLSVRLGKLFLAVGIWLLTIGIFYLVEVLPFFAAIPGFARLLFYGSLAGWALGETATCLCVGLRLQNASTYGRYAFLAFSSACLFAGLYLVDLMQRIS